MEKLGRPKRKKTEKQTNEKTSEDLRECQICGKMRIAQKWNPNEQLEKEEEDEEDAFEWISP